MRINKLIISVITIFLFIFSFQEANATHAIGKELTYRCVGPNQYEVTLIIYRDCNGIALPNNRTVSWTGTCGSGAQTMSKVSQVEVDVHCPSQLSACAGGGGAFGVEAFTYQTTITLPPGCSNINFSASLCCRANGITNLSNSGSENLYVEAQHSLNTSLCNTSPTFQHDPVFIVYTNTGTPMTFPNLAVDMDGDSLVYSLVDALDNNVNPVTYAGGFSGASPLGVGIATINASNGDLTILNPNVMIGVVTILVEEYRNGVKIGEIRRDWSLTVFAGNNAVPTISGLDGTTNFSDTICESDYCTDITVVDADLLQVIETLTLIDTSNNFVFDTLGTNPLTVTVCWDTLKPMIPGTYEFKIEAKDDKCPFSGIAIETYNLTILPQPNANFNYLDSIYCISDGNTVPITSGDIGGVFTSTPLGLNINSTTGIIDLSSSVENIYTIGYNFAGSCPDSATFNLTIGNVISDQVISAAPSFHCNNGSSTVNLGSSELLVDYFLRDNTNDSIIDGPITGTGNSISFNTGNVTDTASYNVLAIDATGNVLDFDGVNDYVALPSLVPTSGDFSVTFWAKQTAPQGGLMEFFSQGTPGNAFYIGHNGAGVFRIGDTWLNSGINISTDGMWHYYALVKSATNTEFYIDDVLVASLGSAIANPSNTEFRLARQYGGYGEYFNGQLDKFSVWNTALTSSEILSNKNDCFNGPKSGLVANYNFEEGIDTILTDNSGNGYNGELINMDGTTDWVTAQNHCRNCSYQLSTIITVPVNNPSTSTDTRTECDSLIWIDGLTYFTNNNTATDTLINIGGCDSIVTLDLTIIPSSIGTDTRTECGSFVWIDGNIYTTNNNTATYNITNGAINGCDSIVTLNLTINTVDTSITVASNVITANATPASYQWLDCNNNYVPISGANNQNYTATTNGSYAVEITQNGCIDTSACYQVISIGVVEKDIFNQVSIYPNPNNGVINVSFGKLKDISIKVYNLQNQLIHYKDNIHKSPFTFELYQASGVYFLEVNTGENKQRYKLVIQ